MAEEYRVTDLLMLVVRRWWVLTLSLVLGVGLGWGALQVVAPTYTATATQLVKGIPGATTGANYIAAQYAVARAKSYPVFIYSSEVLTCSLKYDRQCCGDKPRGQSGRSVGTEGQRAAE